MATRQWNDKEMLEIILVELDEMGFGTDEPIAGFEAVQYLSELRQSLIEHLTVPA